MESVLEWVIIGLLGAGAFAWALFKKFGESTAEEIAKEVVAEMVRDARLTRELEAFRGTQRQEFRIKSYSQLWAIMDPLAIYEDKEVDPVSMETLSDDLTKWYFSAEGGLMLTSVARHFYFALQDLIRAVSSTPGWKAIRTTDDQRQRLLAYFDKEMREGLDPETRLHMEGAKKALDLLKDIDTREWPPEDMETHAKAWRETVRFIAKGWQKIDPRVQFAVLQQVSSVLRTVLTADLESRIR